LAERLVSAEATTDHDGDGNVVRHRDSDAGTVRPRRSTIGQRNAVAKYRMSRLRLDRVLRLAALNGVGRAWKTGAFVAVRQYRSRLKAETNTGP
jgi:hypothetical protein